MNEGMNGSLLEVTDLTPPPALADHKDVVGRLLHLRGPTPRDGTVIDGVGGRSPQMRAA